MSYFSKPQIGTEVEVTTRWPDYYIFRTSDYKENYYVGRVVAGNKAMPKDSFAIIDSTGEYRELALDHVILLRYKGGKVVRSGVRRAPAVPVDHVRVAEGSKGNKYILTRYQGKITCTCPGATYRGHCKHAEMFDKLPKAL